MKGVKVGICLIILVAMFIGINLPRVHASLQTSCTVAPNGNFATVSCALSVTLGDLVLIDYFSAKPTASATPTDSQSNTMTQVIADFGLGTQSSTDTALYSFIAKATGTDTITSDTNPTAQNNHGIIVVDYGQFSGVGAIYKTDDSSINPGVLTYTTPVTTTTLNTFVACFTNFPDANPSGWTPGTSNTNHIQVVGSALSYSFEDDIPTTTAKRYICSASWTTLDRPESMAVEIKSPTLPSSSGNGAPVSFSNGFVGAQTDGVNHVLTTITGFSMISGQRLLVSVSSAVTVGLPFTVDDGDRNTYTLVGPAVGNGIDSQVVYAAIAQTTGAFNINCHVGSTDRSWACIASAWDNVNAVGAIGNFGTGTSTASYSFTVTTTRTNSVLVGIASWGTGGGTTYTPTGSGQVNKVNYQGNSLTFSYFVDSEPTTSIGTYTLSGTYSSGAALLNYGVELMPSIAPPVTVCSTANSGAIVGAEAVVVIMAIMMAQSIGQALGGNFNNQMMKIYMQIIVAVALAIFVSVLILGQLPANIGSGC